ncbi:MAG: endopeptidase La [Saprospiraceae bacterium]
MFEEIVSDTVMQEDGDLMPIFSLEEEQDTPIVDLPEELPILALKNTVLFPGVVIPINIGRKKSVRAINQAHQSHKWIAVLTQHESQMEDPSPKDLYQIGTIARIIKILKMPDGSNTAILQGRQRFQLRSIVRETPYLAGTVDRLNYLDPDDEMEYKALVQSIQEQAKRIVELSPQIPSEAIIMLRNMSNNTFLINFIASNLGLKMEQKQAMLEINDLGALARQVLQYMNSELQLLELRDQIESKVRHDLEKQQRDYFLNQQLKTIQEELGQNPQEEELEAMEARAKKKKWPKEAAELFAKEMARLRRTNPQVAEYSVLLNYVETLLDLPWDTVSKDQFDLHKVRKVMDQDHFGLEKVKERILEHLAVLKLKGDMKAPILCLVGPPGVGKTSLGKSIARSLNREFVRMSLGGLHDEAEIRGHRKTYIGAMPGRIIQSIKKAKTSNPVFILDEIDKLGSDYKGDPSSALLEVLDPEQNSTFHDNYLELEYDLSRVLFIATANSLGSVQPALLDRMEVIEIAGYSMEEKVEIAKRHLIPKQRKEHGLKTNDVRLRDQVIETLIQDYTRESGVRSLDRSLAAVMRWVAKKVAMEETYQKSLQLPDIHQALGPVKFTMDQYQEIGSAGVCIGLAWTRVGGDILFIETSAAPGKGKLILTGNLGDVMKESATTALSYLKAHSNILDIDPQRFEDQDIHIHIPEGAIPKDGPSAGITMLTALASLMTGKKVRPYVAMTGEITLRGKLLPVGGIKEKVLAAKRAGMKEIILCRENERHVAEIEADYVKGLKFTYYERMVDVLNDVLN